MTVISKDTNSSRKKRIDNTMLGERIKELRKEKKLTQEQLANILKVSKSLVGFFETSQREPNFETLEKLVNYFDVSVDYILGRTDVRKPPNKIQNSNIDPRELEMARLISLLDPVNKKAIETIITNLHREVDEKRIVKEELNDAQQSTSSE